MEPKPETRIQIFGDSIMKFVSMDNSSRKYYFSHGYIEQFAARHSLEITNRSSFGSTVKKGFSLLQGTLEKPPAFEYALLEYGGNDCDFCWPEISNAPFKEHCPHTPLGLFEATYRKMISLLRGKSIVPVIMTLPPIDAEKYLNWIVKDGLNENAILQWLGDAQLIYRHQELYSSASARIAREEGCLLVDTRKFFLDCRNYKTLICEDGIHPSEDGYALILRAFEDFIVSRRKSSPAHI